MATITTLYSRNGQATNANTITARNTAFFDLFTALAAATISGWTYVSSTIPTPTTSYLAYDCVFDTGQGFRIRFFTGTTSTTKDYITMSIITTGGANIVVGVISATSTCTLVNNVSGTYTYTCDVKIESIEKASNFYIVRLSSAYATTQVKSCGKLYLTDKAAGADDFVFFNDCYASTAILFYTVAGVSLNAVIPSNLSKDADDKYGCIDLILCDATTNRKYAKVLNAVIIDDSENFTDGQYYSDGTDTYISFMTGVSALLKLPA